MNLNPKEIRALRLALGLRQKEFGLKIGLGNRAVSDLEAGKYAPTPAVALLLKSLSRRHNKKEQISAHPIRPIF